LLQGTSKNLREAPDSADLDETLEEFERLYRHAREIFPRKYGTRIPPEVKAVMAKAESLWKKKGAKMDAAARSRFGEELSNVVTEFNELLRKDGTYREDIDTIGNDDEF
jgi:hypothetical protein